MLRLTKLKKSSSAKTAKTSDISCIEEQIDFEVIFISMSRKFECPINITVNKDFIPEEPKYGKTKSKKLTNVTSFTYDSPLCVESPKPTKHAKVETVKETGDLKLIATYTADYRLAELAIKKYRYQAIPKEVFQLLVIILPNYTKLTKFTVTNCRVDHFAVHEIKNILLVTNITDVNLDATILPESNYCLLLQHCKSLRHLSLNRCNINDETCMEILSQLHYSQPGEMLLTLNLSTNFITDIGAKSIGEALRTNRSLRHLNLADNQITDEGARYIFDVLKEFPLSYAEILEKRLEQSKYLKHLRDIFYKCLEEFETKPSTGMGLKPVGKRKTSAALTKSKNSSKKEKRAMSLDQNKSEDSGKIKAELMALELLGPFTHPFCKSQIKHIDGYFYSKGNLVLCSLNLAYNQLTFLSLQKLLTVLESQQKETSDHFCGLIKVIVAGNRLPHYCDVLSNINDILRQKILHAYGRKSQRTIKEN